MTMIITAFTGIFTEGSIKIDRFLVSKNGPIIRNNCENTQINEHIWH